MIEFFNNCVSPAMLAPTVLLGLCLLYWILVIVGVLGLEAFDVDVDVDAGVDMEAGGHGGYVLESLKFFHLGDVPVMIVLTIFSLGFWFSNYYANAWLNPEWSGLTSLMLVGPCILIALAVTKLVLMPSAKLFEFKDNAQIDRERLFGQKAIVTTSEVTTTFGQAEIKQDGPPIVLNVRVEKGDQFYQSDVVTIVEYDAENDTFLIKSADHVID